MDVAALIIEQLEADGLLKRLTMRPEAGQQLTVGFPDEFDEKQSGPFFFPEQHNEEMFKQGLANCRSLRLSTSSFTAVNGKYHLQIHRGGIPTEDGKQSYYALSLPEYAIPIEIKVKDPRSEKVLHKNVIRDDKRKRFVIYIECRSRYGAFDFLLDAKFRIERESGEFKIAEYSDEYLSQYGGLKPYEALLSPEQTELVCRFLASKIDLNEGARDANPKEAIHELFDTSPKDNGLTPRLRRGKRCAKIIEEMKQIKRAYEAGGLTMTQIEEKHKEFEVWAVMKRLGTEELEHFRRPKQWEPTVGYALLLLSNEYGRNETTVNDWVKDYRQFIRAKN